MESGRLHIKMRSMTIAWISDVLAHPDLILMMETDILGNDEQRAIEAVSLLILIMGLIAAMNAAGSAVQLSFH